MCGQRVLNAGVGRGLRCALPGRPPWRTDANQGGGQVMGELNFQPSTARVLFWFPPDTDPDVVTANIEGALRVMREREEEGA